MGNFRRVKVENIRTTVNDIINCGAIMSFGYFNRDYQNIVSSRYVFKLGKLIAEIRVTCYGDTWAVDVTNPDAYFDSRHCLGTNFNANEAKRLVINWFNENKSEAWNSKKETIRPYQINLFPTYKK